MDDKEKELDVKGFSDDVKNLVHEVGTLIDKYTDLTEKNFALFYQHGRLGYMDLDAFMESTKVRLEESGEEQSLTEVKEIIDRNKK